MYVALSLKCSGFKAYLRGMYRELSSYATARSNAYSLRANRPNERIKVIPITRIGDKDRPKTRADGLPILYDLNKWNLGILRREGD